MMKKILLPVLGAFALILGACSNPGPDPIPPGTTYTVAFKNYDGTVLDEVTVEHGGLAVYGGETPTREAERERERFVWTGWDGSLANIRENKTFTATYDKDYYIRFVNVPRPYETVLEGEGEDAEQVLPNALPTYDDSDVVYEAWFSSNNRVTFEDEEKIVPSTIKINELDQWELQGWSYLNEDEEYENLRSSTTASQTGAVDLFPCYREDAEDKPERIDGVLEAKFINYDYDETLDNYLYRDGVNTNNEEQFAVYGGETPTRPDDETNSYVWLGWYVEGDTEETLVDLTSYVVEDDVVFVAKYNAVPLGETPVTYTVTFANWDETVLFVDTVEQGGTAVYEGKTPTKPDDSENTYTFNGWDRDLTNVQSSFTTKATYVSSPIDVPPTPTKGYNLVVGTTSHPFTLNENNEVQNCEEYMITTGIDLEVDDTFTIKDNENEIVLVTSYRDKDATTDAGSAYFVGDLTHDNAGASTVHVAGAYTFYLKFWEDGAIELWSPRVSEPEPPTPTTEGVYIVGDGSFVEEGLDPWTVESGIKLEVNPNAADYHGFEYMITDLTLEAGDQFRFFDAEANNYVSVSAYSNGSAFSTGDLLAPGATGNETQDNIVVVTPGEYDIYIHNYTDNPSWVEVYATPISEPTPTPTVEDGAYVVGIGSFLTDPTLTWNAAGGVKMETNPNPGENIVTEYTITIDFEVGDTWKLVTVSEGATTWHAWQNGGTPDVFTNGMMHVTEDNDRNIVVDEAGTYTIYLSFYADGNYSTWIQVATPAPVE